MGLGVLGGLGGAEEILLALKGWLASALITPSANHVRLSEAIPAARSMVEMPGSASTEDLDLTRDKEDSRVLGRERASGLAALLEALRSSCADLRGHARPADSPRNRLQ